MMKAIQAPTDLSLYIHMPWCVKKCPYCDFNSHAVKDSIPEKEYINQLIAEFSNHIGITQGRTIKTVFIGGGTPSLISAEGYSTLFQNIRALAQCSDSLEITLEANPGTVDQARFTGFRQAGINRLSIGIQSFDHNQLKNLGRIHNGDDAIKSIEAARGAGFDNINLDLMYALPEQSCNQAIDDLKQALSYKPNHLSWYQLTMEPNTLFYKYPPNLPDENTLIDMEQQGRELLADKGYQHYEISAYAKNKHQCQHNLNYWQFGDYLGIGAGAHSKLTGDDGSTTRLSNLKHPQSYINASDSKVQSKKIVGYDELVFEYMMNHLRLMQPVQFNHMQKLTGLSYQEIKPILQQLKCDGYADYSTQSLRLTAHGQQFLNTVLTYFMT